MQIGAFRVLESAVALKEQVTEEWAEAAPLVTTFRDRGLHRVQVGPLSSGGAGQLPTEAKA